MKLPTKTPRSVSKAHCFGLRSSLELWMLAVLSLALSTTGCQRMPGAQAMRQYQLESDRLLNEFRAQKKRAEELEARNAQLEQRLAESEKMLALNQQGRGPTRSGRGSRETDSFTAGISDKSTSRSGIILGPRTTGLPDMVESYSPPGTLTSSSNRDLRGDRNRDTQWRPVQGSSR